MNKTKVSKLRVRKSRSRISSNSSVKLEVLKILKNAEDWLTTRETTNLYHGIDKDDTTTFSTEEVDSFLQNVLYSFKIPKSLIKGYSGISCVWALPENITETKDGFEFQKPKPVK